MRDSNQRIKILVGWGRPFLKLCRLCGRSTIVYREIASGANPFLKGFIVASLGRHFLAKNASLPDLFPRQNLFKHTFQGSNSKTSMFSQPWQQMQIFPSRSTHSVQQHQKKMMAKSHGIFATVTPPAVFSYSWPMV